MSEDRIKFIEYVTKLAFETGETALLLKQKPTLVGGEMVYHGDGAPKATFPSFLPAKANIKPGDAWYVNTGSFIVDRFVDGKPSAKSENVEYVLFMMLDDIGTKSKEPPLAPTWIMETSEGSFQWGYAFSEQPSKADFTAAITAIADAGYTDPGATNAVRNCRIPGSVNLKRGRGNFEARLVEFHPDREYTLDEVCAALGVVPPESDTAEIKSIKIRDTGQDNVLAWLSDNSMVLSRVNNEGWCGVVCPNHAAHSDGSIEGRYKPLDRSYCCYHGHCQDLTSTTFLKWVSDNGGPTVTPGLRDELIAERMRLMAEKISPTEAFPDQAAITVKEVERKEAGRLLKTEWFDRFAYVQSDDSYFDMVTRQEVPRNVFNALFRHVDCRSIHNNKRQVAASVYYDERRQEFGAKALTGITYAAGEDVLVARDGLVYGNRWVNARPDMSATLSVSDAQITPWLDHCRSLIEEPSELEHIFDVMAYKVQHPNVKINHAVLHGGDEGSGKDTMWAPFLWAIGGKHQHNRSIIETGEINSQWGYNLEAEVLILNELREPEAKERRALANKLKPIIAAPPETLLINRKGLHPYEMLNRVQVVAFTNDPLPITLPTQDRRWLCVWSRAPRMHPDEAAVLWDWYKAGGYEKIAAWLHLRDVSAFNPAAAPPVTEWKLNMVEQGMSVAESYLVDMMRLRVGPFASGVIGGPFHKLCDLLVADSKVPAGVKVPQAALLHALKEAGWMDCGRLGSVDFQTKRHIFAAPEVARIHSKSDLRRMVENIDTTGAKVVGIHQQRTPNQRG
jgi:hypothetical protein